jgi:mannan endo-1,4-beta-mannosidase
MLVFPGYVVNRNLLCTLVSLFVLFLGLFPVAGQDAIPEIPGIYEVTPNQRINIRSFASTGADVVGVVNSGTRIEVLDQLTGERVDGTDLWFSVRVEGQEGYILSSLLRFVEPMGDVEAAAPETADAARSAQTANANASPAAQAVLAYLYDLPNRGENRVISGQFGAYGDGTSRATAEEQLKRIFDQSGLTPGLTGMDYQRWDMNNQNDFTEPNSFLISQWNAGLLVNVSWHANNPWTGGPSTDWENTATEDPYDTRPVRELITPGNAAYDRWMLMLDNIAGGLQQLEDAGVVVIWRPLHEMNGGWAWWQRQTPEDFTTLWQHMFNYFTLEKGLDNLLWAYSPMINGTEFDFRAMHYYPGDAYVDIVGLDKYMAIGEDPLDLNRWGDYDALVATGKPVGLFEFGPLPATGEGWDTVQYDYANLIRDIRQLYPRIVLFQAWEYIWQIGNHQNASGLLNDPWVIVQGELPTWPTG